MLTVLTYYYVSYNVTTIVKDGDGNPGCGWGYDPQGPC